MVFVDNIQQLEYYSPNPQFGCYSDPVFQPSDILLQANGFNADTYGIVIYVCDTSGAVLEDATSYFDTFLGQFVIAGNTYSYVNIRCNTYSPFMLSNKCFVLLVQITDPSTGEFLFSKYTQKYIIANSGLVYADNVTMDDSPLQNCVVGANVITCDTNYVKIGCSFNCIDTYSGDYYGPVTAIVGEGAYPFVFTRFSYIEGRFREVPKEIKRVISINCRTQKTETTPQYLLTGGTTFPVWKMLELEHMLLADHIYIDGNEYQTQGGTPFEQFGRPFNCQYRYKFTLQMQGCFQFQTFGCKPNCDDLATYYAFPRPFNKLYDDSQRLIATDSTELAIYFQSQPGYKSVQNLPFILPCPVNTLMVVQSSGVLPKFIYVDNVAASSRIFPKQLPVNTLDFTPLCNGVNYGNQVPVPEVEGYVSESVIVPVPEVTGYVSQDANKYILSIIPAGLGWDVNTHVTSAVNYMGEVMLNVSVGTATRVPPYVNETLGIISQQGIPTSKVIIYGDDNPNLMPGSMLEIGTDGAIVYTGDYTDGIDPDYKIEFFGVKYKI